MMTSMDCYCCEVRDLNVGDPSHHPAAPQPAAYLWTNNLGDQAKLCIPCCAEWRAGEARRQSYNGDPAFAPASITQLQPIR